jgi:hypothetical protein
MALLHLTSSRIIANSPSVPPCLFVSPPSVSISVLSFHPLSHSCVTTPATHSTPSPHGNLVCLSSRDGFVS